MKDHPTILKPQKTDSIIGEPQAVHDQITQRAYEIFCTRGGGGGYELDDWLTAEREVAWKPPIELCEKERAFVVRAALAGVDPCDLDLRITPDDLLIRAKTRHEHTETRGTVHMCEFMPGELWRTVHFPERVDPDQVKAEFHYGMLRLTAVIAQRAAAEQPRVRAA